MPRLIFLSDLGMVTEMSDSYFRVLQGQSLNLPYVQWKPSLKMLKGFKMMSQIAVVYKSQYGYTKTYARWIAEELSADLLEAGTVKISDLEQYHTVVYGGGLYAGGVNGISLITQNFDELKEKELYLFTVGAADVTNEENIASIRSSLTRALTPTMMQKIKIYHLRGGLCYSRMSFIHKSMMGLMHKMLLKKPESELSADDKGLLATYGKDVNFVDMSMASALIADVMQIK